MVNLKRAAFLNGLTGGLDYTARLIVVFGLNPYILISIGDVFFGVWKILGQLNSYMAVGDLRAGTSLKWMVSKDRSVIDDTQLAKTFSTALYSCLLLTPLYLTVGFVIIYISPYVTNVNQEEFSLIRYTAAILVFGFISTQFFFLYESLLQAMNMAYKRIGIRAAIIIFGGLLSALVLYLEYGLIGLAAVNVITIFLNGLTLKWIVKKYIDWYKIVKVNFREVKAFTSLSLMFLLQKFADLANTMTDMVLLGFFAGPLLVTQYTFSLFAMMGIQGITQIISTSVLPGLGKFYGEKNFLVIANIRVKIIELKRLFLTVGAVVVCIINQDFVKLWSQSSGQFVGLWESYLITILIVLRTLTLVDSSLINISLNIKNKIIYSIISGLIIIIGSIVLIPILETLGLLLALIGGAITQSVLYATLLSRNFKKYNLYKVLYYNRSFIISNVFIFASALLSQYVLLDSWLNLIVFSTLVAILVTFIYVFTALKPNDRNWFISSLKSALNKKL